MTDTSMFTPSDGEGEGDVEGVSTESTQNPDPSPGEPPELPDWVSEKYRSAPNPIEEQAKAYAEAQRRLATKTEDLRAEVRDEISAEIRAEMQAKVPEDGAYEYPEGWQPPEIEGLDERFKTWAKENGISQEGFNQLVEMYGEAMAVPDLDAEKAKLGANADERIAAINARGSRAIPKEMHGIAMKVMATAEGVMLVEHLLGLGTQVRPASTQSESVPPQSLEEMRTELRKLMASPSISQNTAEGRKTKAAADALSAQIAAAIAKGAR